MSGTRWKVGRSFGFESLTNYRPTKCRLKYLLLDPPDVLLRPQHFFFQKPLCITVIWQSSMGSLNNVFRRDRCARCIAPTWWRHDRYNSTCVRTPSDNELWGQNKQKAPAENKKIYLRWTRLAIQGWINVKASVMVEVGTEVTVRIKICIRGRDWVGVK